MLIKGGGRESGREEQWLDILFVLSSESCFASGLHSVIEDRRNSLFKHLDQAGSSHLPARPSYLILNLDHD